MERLYYTELSFDRPNSALERDSLTVEISYAGLHEFATTMAISKIALLCQWANLWEVAQPLTSTPLEVASLNPVYIN